MTKRTATQKIRSWKSSVRRGTYSGCFRRRIGVTGIEVTVAPAWSERKDGPVKTFKSRKQLVSAIADAIEHINIHGLG